MGMSVGGSRGFSAPVSAPVQRAPQPPKPPVEVQSAPSAQTVATELMQSLNTEGTKARHVNLIA